MCHNIVDGRLHNVCHHFEGLHTRKQDCFKSECIFSTRHGHPSNCRSSSCKKLMDPPVQHPIRISESKCASCIMSPANGRLVGC